MQKLRLTLGLVVALALGSAHAYAQVPVRHFAAVRTLAGVAGKKSAADGPGPEARFNFPHSVAVDAAGSVYVADMDGHTIRKISPGGVVTTLAGRAGQKGALDGDGSQARFNSPAGIVAAADGTLYVADAGSHTIRRISPAGAVSTFAGVAGHKGAADGPGTGTTFSFPHGLALGDDGTLYVADTYGHTIRKISPAGRVTTLAGQPGQKGSTDGVGNAAQFFHPSGLAVDAQGVVYVADNGNNTIRRITPAGAVTTVAGQAGKKGSTDGPGPEARFRVPASVALAADGTLYVADYLNSTIRQLTPQGEVSTAAGSAQGWISLDGALPEARLRFPFGVAVGPEGRVYVAESGSNTVRVLE